MPEATSAPDRVRTELLRLIEERRPGDRLPSTRELVERLRVSPVTLGKALSRLAAEGRVVTQTGSGTFVTGDAGRRPAPRLDTDWQSVVLGDSPLDADVTERLSGPPAAGRFVLDGGYLHDSLQPTAALTAALGRASRRPDAWGRAPAAGLPALRELFAADSGADIHADDVLVTAGGQNALSLVFRAVGRPGDAVLVESPTYPGALAAIRAAGLRPVPVPTDVAGLRADLLEESFARSGARLVYCQPTHQNPTGATMSAERRAGLVAAAGAHGAFVVEDDFARHLGHDDTRRSPLIDDDPNGCVIQVTSLTKPVAPSLRIGAIVARGPVMRRLQAARRAVDFFISLPLQEAAVDLLVSPGWQRHRRRLAKALDERRTTVLRALATHRPEWVVPSPPRGGLHVWVRLPERADPARVAGAAATVGVSVAGGDRFFPAEPAGPFLRLALGAAPDLGALEEGVRLLASATPG
ncbi:DNA-binding transcriptional MocR family regulator [Nocardioides thalensis]|uniref:DNA-binding transcriptional MocR family regulator n=1 Tax=Nocardioides thalensis TaxID=1914755 RepID=A0A853BZ40_9ACTN|nr:PLP-dependent aminotransferase family protein [Nocardioides thalensis]NYI99657.1 DNA-binding transcriptional MocR family regulator [Nocardioides thalensis]